MLRHPRASHFWNLQGCPEKGKEKQFGNIGIQHYFNPAINLLQYKPLKTFSWATLENQQGNDNCDKFPQTFDGSMQPNDTKKEILENIKASGWRNLSSITRVCMQVTCKSATNLHFNTQATSSKASNITNDQRK